MSSAAWSLQQAIHALLSSDAALAALLGGQDRVFDHVPQGRALPYVTLAQTSIRDWSTADLDGEEHTITLNVWSSAFGKKQVQEVLGRLRALLHDRALTLSGHRLVNLRHEFSEARRDPDGEILLGRARFRAVTEPL